MAPRASRPKNEWVKVTPEGLELRERRYFATDEVLNYFKRHAKDWAKGAKLAPHRAEPKKQAPVVQPGPLQPIQQQWAPPPQQQLPEELLDDPVLRRARAMLAAAAPPPPAPVPAESSSSGEDLMARIARLAQTEDEPPLTFEPLK